MEYTGWRDNGVNAHPAVAKVGLGGVFDIVRNSVEPARKTLGIIGMGRIGQAMHGHRGRWSHPRPPCTSLVVIDTNCVEGFCELCEWPRRSRLSRGSASAPSTWTRSTPPPPRGKIRPPQGPFWGLKTKLFTAVDFCGNYVVGPGNTAVGNTAVGNTALGNSALGARAARAGHLL